MLVSEADCTVYCSGCGQQKKTSDFHKNKAQKTGLSTQCKSCAIERANKWQQDNRAKRKEYMRRYYEANKARWEESYAQLDSEANREKARRWAREHPERNRERVQQWARDNPEKRRAQRALRRYRENGSGTLSAADIMQMYDDQDGLCAYCEIPLFGEYHLDHMIPVSRGGIHDWSNIAIACQPCNQRKHAKTAEEFVRMNLATD
jgi:5-methylcytosine-specific restriction endonuclease McrA